MILNLELVPRHRQRGVVLLVLLCLLAPPWARADYKEVYIDGLRSFDFNKWQEALMLFAAASREEAPQGQTVRPYGMRFEPYLPYFYQGMCLYRLGKYQEAVQAWQEAERIGAIGPKQKKRWWLKQQKLRDEIGSRIGEEMQGVADETEAAGRQVEILESLVVEQELDEPELTALLQEIRELLQGVDETMSTKLGRLEMEEVSELEALIEEVWDRLAEASDAVAERMRLQRERERGEERQRQLAGLLEKYEWAVARLTVETCDRRALKTLTSVVTGARSASVDLASHGLTPHLWLARGHHRCGDLIQARIQLDLARQTESSLVADALDVVSGEIAAVSAMRERRARYAGLEMKIDLGRCDRDLIRELEHLAPSLQSDGLEGLAASPNLRLAEAYANCSSLAEAEEALALAVAEGFDDHDRLATVSGRIGQLLEERREAEHREILAAELDSLTQAIRRQCDRDALRSLEALVGSGRAATVVDLQPELAPLVTLARGYLSCGDLESATLWAGRAEAGETRPGVVGELAAIRSDISAEESRRQRRLEIERAVSDYLVAMSRIETGSCDEAAQELLIQSSTVLQPIRGFSDWPDVAALFGDEEYTPQLLLALSRKNCGDEQGARANLRLARERGPITDRAIEVEIEEWLETQARLAIYGKSHALLVGATDYEAAPSGSGSGWPSLPGVRQDIARIREVLEKHGFEVTVLWNPESGTFDESMKKFIGEHGLEPDTRLLFYYAGHGWTESNFGVRLGYIVPVNSPLPTRESGQYLRHLISMETFEVYAKEIRSRHAVFLFDSCFSGTVFDATKSRLLTQESVGEGVDDLLSQPVRLFMTAGDEGEQVPDESSFSAALTQALGGMADADANGLVLGREIGAYVREKGASSRSTPQWGLLDHPSFNQGDVAFERLSVTTQTAASDPAQVLVSRGLRGHPLDNELEIWKAVEERNDLEAYAEYLDAYPQGRFAPLARARQEELRTDG